MCWLCSRGSPAIRTTFLRLRRRAIQITEPDAASQRSSLNNSEWVRRREAPIILALDPREHVAWSTDSGATWHYGSDNGQYRSYMNNHDVAHPATRMPQYGWRRSDGTRIGQQPALSASRGCAARAGACARDRATPKLRQPQNCERQSAFAGPAQSNQRDNLARPDPRLDIVQHLRIAVSRGDSKLKNRPEVTQSAATRHSTISVEAQPPVAPRAAPERWRRDSPD